MRPTNPIHTWHNQIQYGDASILSYLLSWGAHSLTSNPFRYYDVPLAFPQSQVLAGMDGMIFQAALATPIWLATKNPVLLYNCVIFLSFWFCLICGYTSALLLLRSRMIAITVAVMFTVTTDRYFHTNGHANLVFTGFLPLVYTFTALSLRTGSIKFALIAGTAFGISVYASNYLFVLSSLMFAVPILITLVLQRFRLNSRQYRTILSAGCLAAALAWPVPLIHWKASQGVVTNRSDISSAEAGSATLPGWMKPPNYPESIYSRLAKLMDLGETQNPRGEDCQFFGITMLFCILIESLRLIRQRMRRIWTEQDTISTALIAIAVCFVLATFGPYLQIGRFQFPGPYLAIYKSYLQFTGFFRVPSRLAFISEWLFALSVGILLTATIGKFRIQRTAACVVIVTLTLFEHVPTSSAARWDWNDSFDVNEKLNELDPSGSEPLLILPDPQSLGLPGLVTTSNWRPLVNAWPDNPLLTDYTRFFESINAIESTDAAGLMAQRGVKWIIALSEDVIDQADRSNFLIQEFRQPNRALYRLTKADELREFNDKKRIDAESEILKARRALPENPRISVSTIPGYKINGYLTKVEQTSNEVKLLSETDGFLSGTWSFPDFPVRPGVFNQIVIRYTLNKQSDHQIAMYWSSPQVHISQRTYIAGSKKRNADGSYTATINLSGHPDWMYIDKLQSLRFDFSQIVKTGANAVVVHDIDFLSELQHSVENK